MSSVQAVCGESSTKVVVRTELSTGDAISRARENRLYTKKFIPRSAKVFEIVSFKGRGEGQYDRCLRSLSYGSADGSDTIKLYRDNVVGESG